MRVPLAVLVHGMGRTPVSMVLLAYRLRRKGFRTAIFGYSVTVEKFPSCLARLQRFIEARVGTEPYIVTGHSLGAVLLRCVLPPVAANAGGVLPVGASLASVRFRAPARAASAVPHPHGRDGAACSRTRKFMQSVPIPRCSTRIYAGTGGPSTNLFAIGDEPNDGVLKVSETALPGVPVVLVPAMHTFLMNSRAVAGGLVQRARAAAFRGFLSGP